MRHFILSVIFLAFYIFSNAQVEKFEAKTGTSNPKVLIEKKEPGHELTLNYNFLKDFDHMSIAVKNRINNNKLNGLNLADGISKSYKIIVKHCDTVEIAKKMFSFLKSKNGFLKINYVSDGIVQIFVVPNFSSEDLKETLLSQNITFNFISEEYQLN